MEHFFATCPRGLEGVLKDELATLGADNISAVDGGVHFAGEFAFCYSVNLESRVASRVLWRVAEGQYQSDKDIYEAARSLPWHRWFSVENSIRVDVAAIRAAVK